MAQKARRGQSGSTGRRTPRSVPTTFRVDADTFEGISSLADKEKTSINAVVNRALRRHIEWEVFAEKFGLQSVTGATLTKLFDLITDKQARELGENYGNNIAPELITFWFKKLDFTTILKALELLGMRYGRLFHFDYVSEGAKCRLFIRHERGMKLSIYYEAAAKALFGRLGIKPETSLTQSQVTVTIFTKEVLNAKPA